MAKSIQLQHGKLYPPGTRGKFWTWRGTINGVEYEKSTRAADRREAVEVAEEIARVIRESDRRELCTVTDVAIAYADYAHLTTPNRRFLGFICDVIGDRAVWEVSEADLPAIERLKPKASAATLNRSIRKPLRALLMWAWRQKLCERPEIALLKEREPDRRAAPDAAGRAFLSATDGHQHAFVAMMFFQGWRVSDALALRWDDVDFENRRLRVYVGKSRRWKQIHMHGETLAALANLPEREGRVFDRWDSPNAIYKWWRRLQAETGWKVTPHQFRHAWAAHMRRQHATAPDMIQGNTWINAQSVGHYLRDDNPEVPRMMEVKR